MKVKVETPRHTLVQYPNFRRIGREAEVLEPSVKVFKKKSLQAGRAQSDEDDSRFQTDKASRVFLQISANLLKAKSFCRMPH